MFSVFVSDFEGMIYTVVAFIKKQNTIFLMNSIHFWLSPMTNFPFFLFIVVEAVPVLLHRHRMSSGM